MQLTPDQLSAEEALLNFLSSDAKCFVLQGYAGTGKTTIIKHLINSFKLKEKLFKVIDSNYKEKEWALTATTNKAAEALSTATGMDTTTVHSLLDIKVRNDYETGHTYSYRRKDAEVKDNLIIVIDECSYIDDKLLSIINHATFPSCKIIFMGDPSQLTPVGSNEVPVFNQDYPSATLNQVVRQDATNPIQEICTNLRKTIQESVGFPKISKSAEVVHLTKEDFETEIVKEFSRADWKQGDSKILAWRNKTVHQYNTAVFKHINNRSEFQKGDYVLNNHFVSGLKADTEYMIEKCYACTAYNDTKGFNVQVVGKLEHLFLPKNIKDYDKAKKRALKENDSSRVKEIMEEWVDLRPSYACTVNKSQGSTYNKVFIDLGDLAKCRDALQLARLLYVAISRARYQVIFTGDLG